MKPCTVDFPYLFENKKSIFEVQLLINSNVLLPPAAKREELINFPDQSQALGCAITPIAIAAWDKVKRRRLCASLITACLKETLPPYLIFSYVSSISDRK